MGEKWGKMGKKWVKNEITGLQKTVLMHASAHLGSAPEDLAYKLSLNSYKNSRAAERELDETLFAYHVDTPSNGEFTAILTLASAGCVQFAASP